ncbi:tetratricopeptide repeat protein [Streptomyces mesophilus]|uniref:tetratricopeptide repeat protein n=1 Tax=Streptomyces mesophilus TaxID=1775132 RepID=UPI00332C66A7
MANEQEREAPGSDWPPPFGQGTGQGTERTAGYGTQREPEDRWATPDARPLGAWAGPEAAGPGPSEPFTSEPFTSEPVTTEGRRTPPRRDSAHALRRTVITSVIGSVVLSCSVFALPLVVEHGPEPAPGPVGRAMQAVGAGAPASLTDLGALIADREAHLAKHPGDEESWAVLGGAYVEHGKRTADRGLYTQAEQALNRSLAARPADQGNIEALAAMAALANARHDYRAAKKWGELAVMQKPGRWNLYPVLIDTYDRLGDYKAADKALEKLQELHNNAAIMARSAELYVDRGWRENAAAAIVDAAALADAPAEQAAYQHSVGEHAWERGEPAEALRWFETALRTDPEHYPAIGGRARALAALGRTTDALATYQDVLRKLPLPQYAVELGELYESIGLDAAANAQYDVVRRQLADPGADQLVLGLFEADHGDADAAVVRLTAEFRRHPGRQVTDALGWAHYRAGDNKQALAYAKRAMDKDAPRSALFAYHRGQIERAVGEYGAARRFLTEALKVNPHFSQVHAPAAQEALDALGEPPPGGPANVTGEKPQAPSLGRPSGSRQQVAPTGRGGPKSSQQGGSSSRKGSGSSTYKKQTPRTREQAPQRTTPRKQSGGSGSGSGGSGSGGGTKPTPKRTAR